MTANFRENYKLVRRESAGSGRFGQAHGHFETGGLAVAAGGIRCRQRGRYRAGKVVGIGGAWLRFDPLAVMLQRTRRVGLVWARG